MKNIITGVLLASLTTLLPASANNLKDDEYFTNHSMGCMMMRECTEDVEEVTTIKDVESYQGKDHSLIGDEFNNLVKVLNEVGVNVYITPMHYFLIGTKGVYYTEGNNIFLNSDMLERSSTLMSTMRHEGWHTAQDCMAGDIKNRFIAVIFDEKKIPKYLRRMTEKTYSGSLLHKKSIPWEQEAYWAGYTKGMTQDALKACADGAMWEIYPPTPLTRQFLIDEGYIKE